MARTHDFHALEGILFDEDSTISQPLVDWNLPPIYDEYTEEGFLIQRDQYSSSTPNVMSLIEYSELPSCDEYLQHIVVEEKKQISAPKIQQGLLSEPTLILGKRKDDGQCDWITCLEHNLKEIVHLVFGDPLMIGRGRINLKYKVDADKIRLSKLFQAMETRGRVFEERENDAGA
jgi:hypothetical protein